MSHQKSPTEHFRISSSHCLTSHPINERPIGAVHLVGKYEAEGDDWSQHARFFSFNGSEDEHKKIRRNMFTFLAQNDTFVILNVSFLNFFSQFPMVLVQFQVVEVCLRSGWDEE